MELLILVISNYDVANLQVYFEYLPPFIITNLYFITSIQWLSNYQIRYNKFRKIENGTKIKTWFADLW